MSRVEFVEEELGLRPGQLRLPEWALEHDRELEAAPLQDYGFVGDAELIRPQ